MVVQRPEARTDCPHVLTAGPAATDASGALEDASSSNPGEHSPPWLSTNVLALPVHGGGARCLALQLSILSVLVSDYPTPALPSILLCRSLPALRLATERSLSPSACPPLFAIKPARHEAISALRLSRAFASALLNSPCINPSFIHQPVLRETRPALFLSAGLWAPILLPSPTANHSLSS